MIDLSIAVLLAISSTAAAAPAADTDATKVAKRLADTIRKSGEFRDSDFVQPLGPASRAALHRLSSCKVDSIDHWLSPDPTEQDAYLPNPNKVGVTYACAGVPVTSPVTISLLLSNGKIATIETHNMDLLKGR
jgi:hypothetical protein